MAQVSNKAWEKIFDEYNIHQHSFQDRPFDISAEQIKRACQNFTKTKDKEVRVLCTQTCNEDRPDIFKQKGLFLLPVQNGHYNIINGKGYINVPKVESEVIDYPIKLDFDLDTSRVGQSEMQYLDYVFAVSLIWYSSVKVVKKIA